MEALGTSAVRGGISGPRGGRALPPRASQRGLWGAEKRRGKVGQRFGAGRVAAVETCAGAEEYTFCVADADGMVLSDPSCNTDQGVSHRCE